MLIKDHGHGELKLLQLWAALIVGDSKRRVKCKLQQVKRGVA
jgi:hypothetical protein